MNDRQSLVLALTRAGFRAVDPDDGGSARSHEPAVGKLLLRVEEVADLLDIGRTAVYRLVRAGDLQSVKIGGSRRIPSTALQQYLDRLLDQIA